MPLAEELVTVCVGLRGDAGSAWQCAWQCAWGCGSCV